MPFMLKEDEPWENKFYELDKDPEIRRWRLRVRASRHVDKSSTTHFKMFKMKMPLTSL